MAGGFDWRYVTSLAADPRSAASARAFVDQHLGEHRLGHLVDPVRLVASELATNALLHARTGFTVTLSEWDRVVTLSVEDQQPTQVPTLGRSDLSDEGGRGMRIVDQLSQSWGVSSDSRGAKSVWASFAC